MQRRTMRVNMNRFLSVRSFVIAITVSVTVLLYAQPFSSGSDGSDGALDLPASLGTVIFDPFDTARWGRVLDIDGDGVYNFTTITIGANSTLRLTGDKVNRPLYWLASGNVVIAGTLDLSGAAGIPNPNADLDVRRQQAVPGPGGFTGGAGGRTVAPLVPTPGEGPGGGSGGVPNTCGQFGNFQCGRGGSFVGNRFLVPLIGGSGGEGGYAASSTAIGPNGGAGGGAILIASSTEVAVNGQILATGGRGGDGGQSFQNGGGGSGGAIRLVAPRITGSGRLEVHGLHWGNFPGNSPVVGGSGWIRLEANQISSTLNFSPQANAVTRGAPGAPSTLRPVSSIRVTAVDGKALLPNPTGGFQLPDVSIDKNTPVNVEIEGSGIPDGTVVTLQIYPEAPIDPLTIVLTTQATLSGTLARTTATATIMFPYGFSRGFVRATWAR
jgi:hypothetical protein